MFIKIAYRCQCIKIIFSKKKEEEINKIKMLN